MELIIIHKLHATCDAISFIVGYGPRFRRDTKWSLDLDLNFTMESAHHCLSTNVFQFDLDSVASVSDKPADGDLTAAFQSTNPFLKDIIDEAKSAAVDAEVWLRLFGFIRVRVNNAPVFKLALGSIIKARKNGVPV